MKKNILFTGVLLLVFCGLAAQNTYRSQIYNAFIGGDINKWVVVLKNMEKDKLNTSDKKLELVGYYYGYIGYLLGRKNYNEAEKYIAKGDKLVDEVLKISPKNATAYSYKGSFIGFKIDLSKFKALTLGKESVANVDKALSIDPLNTQALIDKANTLYHTPKIFGGDKAEAIKYFEKAIKVFENSKNTRENWLYLNTLIQLAKTRESLEQYTSAAHLYEKVLLVEPRFNWVKNDLYPSLRAKMKS